VAGVKTPIGVAILQYVVKFHCDEWRWGRPIFTDWPKNRLPLQCPLSDSNSQNKCSLYVSTHICTNPENLVMISPVRSGVIGLQG